MKIFIQELKYWFKQPSIYIYSILLFFLALLMMGEDVGVWLDVPADHIANTPMEIYGKTNWFMRFILLLLPTILGISVYRDVKSNIHSLLYVYPFSKGKYLLSKFASSFLVLTIVVAFIGIGLWAATQMPSAKSEMLTEFDFLPYLQTYLVFVIPNALFLGAVIFSVVALTRNIYAGFVVIIILYVLQGLVGSLFGNTDNLYLAALLDPTGSGALMYLTRYWTPAEITINSLPIEGIVIVNRILWLSMAILVLAFTYWKFQFSQQPVSFAFFKNKNTDTKISQRKLGSITKIILPKVNYNFSLLERLKTTWKLSNIEFRYIATHRMFIIILVAGSLAIFFQLANVQQTDGFQMLPTTSKMLQLPMMMFSGIINILTFLYAGMLVQRGKVAEMNQLIDTSATTNGVLFGSKFIALLKMQLLMLSLIMIGGIGAQLYNGFTRLEIGHYLFELYILNFLAFAIWAMVAIFIQTVFTNAYLGLFLLVMGSMGMVALSQFGVEPAVFRYNMGPSFGYSDMEGYGNSLMPYLVYKLYWILFGGFLLLGTLLFWVRGLPFTFLERFKIAIMRVRSRVGVAMIILLVSFLALGFKIYHEEYIKYGDSVISHKDQRDFIQDFQKKYKHLNATPQPKIVAIKTNVDIFPYKNRFEAAGEYILKNKTNSLIDTLIIRRSFDEETTYEFNVNATAIVRDTNMRFDIWKLEKPLQPNDSLTLTFQIQSPENTFFRKYHNVTNNGTFLSIDIFPKIGMLRFGPKPYPTDSLALETSYNGQDADWIDFEATVSTSDDQIALSAGYLQKEWTENGRNYFHYKMDTPIKFFFGFNSGRFEVLKDTSAGVSLEVYYDKKHPDNIHRMMKGLKMTLAFCNENYSTYQHKQARIIEYPSSLGSYSTTFANSIPFAEYNFLADIRDDEGDVDIPFYVAAHELAHQWWGNQVAPANVVGARMVTESLAEYTALKVLERAYGEAPMKQFLAIDLDAYLKGRSRDYHPEQPLITATHGQEYINYRKGALVFYALSDYLGEARFNGILKKYIEQVKYRQPYTTSLELVSLIQSELPDSLQYLVRDMFETITLYDNMATNATVTPLDNGKYEIDFQFRVGKYRIKGKGKRAYTSESGDSLLYHSEELNKDILSLPLADYIDIGVLDKNGDLLYLKKHKITKIKNSIKIIVDEKPAKVGVDPLNKLIDTRSSDNLVVL